MKKTKQLTAVEWLVQKVELISNNKTLSKKEAIDLYNKSIEQANKMFEQQIIDAYKEGFSFGVAMLKQKQEEYVNGKKYFNQTFNK